MNEFCHFRRGRRGCGWSQIWNVTSERPAIDWRQGFWLGGGEKKDKTIARKLAQHNLKRTKIKEKEKKDTDRQTDKIITVLVDMTEVLVDMTKVLVDMTEGNILSVHTDHF